MFRFDERFYRLSPRSGPRRVGEDDAEQGDGVVRAAGTGRRAPAPRGTAEGATAANQSVPDLCVDAAGAKVSDQAGGLSRGRSWLVLGREERGLAVLGSGV